MGLLKEYPRRSAEIWAEEKYEDMYLDPISLLGADTPWADMGVLYQKKDSGVERLCYCAVAPSVGIAQAPSGSNTYVPGQVKIGEPKKKKEKYAMFYGEGMDMMTDDQRNIAQSVVSAIFQSPEFGFLRQLMEAKKQQESEGAEQQPDAMSPLGGGGAEIGEPASPPASVAPATPPSAPDESLDEEEDEPFTENDFSTASPEEGPAPAEEPESLPEPSEEPTPTDEAEEPALDEEEPEDELDEEPSLNQPSEDLETDETDEEPEDNINDVEPADESTDELDDEDYDESYEEEPMDNGKVDDFERRIHRLEVLLNASLKKSTTQERYSKLSDLRQRYLFDENAEREKCAYAKMNDEEFENHCADIEANYRKNPNYIEVPAYLTQSASQYAGDRPGAVQYSKEREDQIEAEVMKIAHRNAYNGKFQSAEEIREEVARNFGNVQ